jgi:DNA-binding NtrC family response regulator
MGAVRDQKKILSIAKTDFLRRTRQAALRKAGYAVWSAKDFNEIESLSKSGTFDVAIIGQAFAPEVKRTIAEVIRKYFPRTPIVELTTTNNADIANSILSSPKPAALRSTLRAVLEVAKVKRAKSSN